MKLNLLLVDDERSIVDPIVDFITINHPEKYNVMVANSGKEAQVYLKKEKVDIVVSDYNMSQGNGLELISEVKKINPDVPFILMTGHANKKLTIDFNNKDCFYMFEKPFEIDVLVLKIEEAYSGIQARSLEKKFSFLGESQASVLHDINNPLTVILGNADILQSMAKGKVDSKRMEKSAEAISNAAERIKVMIKNYQRLLHPENKYSLSCVNLSDYFAQYMNQANPLIKAHNISVDLEISEDCKVNIDPSQFSRVLDNLIINSIHAIKKVENPKIKILVNKHDNNVHIYIKDNGPKISQEVRNQMFKKNFTTKDHGTGMGLASGKETINSFFGEMSLLPSDETTFLIKLPVSKA